MRLHAISLVHQGWSGMNGADAAALLIVVLGIGFARVLIWLLLAGVRGSYKKFATCILARFRLPLQGLIILSGCLVETTKGTWVHISSHYPIYSSLFILLISWGLWRQANQVKVILQLLDRRWNQPFHEIAVPLLRRASKLMIMMSTLLWLAYTWGWHMQQWLMGMGIIGIAVSLAVRDVVMNMLSAFELLVNNTYDIGDWIEINQTSGEVEAITLRFTTLRTLSQDVLTIPNSNMANSTVTNWSRKKKQLVQMDIYMEPCSRGEAISDSIVQVLDALRNRKDVYPDSVFCDFQENTNGSLLLSVRLYSITTEQEKWVQIKIECYQEISDILARHKLTKS